MYKYRCISEEGDVLLATDDKSDVIKAVYGELGGPAAYAVLTLGEDGEYHVDETCW